MGDVLQNVIARALSEHNPLTYLLHEGIVLGITTNTAIRIIMATITLTTTAICHRR